MDKVNLLSQVNEGDIVYDRDGDQVGTVIFVQMTDEVPAKPGPETATTPETTHEPAWIGSEIAEVLVGETELPEEVREKLLRERFIRVKTGMFHADRFVMPELITQVNDEGVYLSIVGEDLLKSR